MKGVVWLPVGRVLDEILGGATTEGVQHLLVPRSGLVGQGGEDAQPGLGLPTTPGGEDDTHQRIRQRLGKAQFSLSLGLELSHVHHVPKVPHGRAGDQPTQRDDLLYHLSHALAEEPVLRLARRVHAQFGELTQVVEAEEAVASLQMVVQELEGPTLGKRGEPERELGELHGQRVHVHAVEAALGHQPPSQDGALLHVGGQRFEVVVGAAHTTFGVEDAVSGLLA